MTSSIGLLDLKDAFSWAHDRHSGQKKKGTDIPFLYHPMAVASLVLKYGGNSDQAQAALLHDTFCDGLVTLDEIQNRFGANVSRMVAAFAETNEESWQKRKKEYLSTLSDVKEDALLVIACEELHEGTELLHDLRYRGAEVWKRYPVHGMEVFWYFRELLQILNRRLEEKRARALVSDFAAFVKALKEVTLEGAVY